MLKISTPSYIAMFDQRRARGNLTYNCALGQAKVLILDGNSEMYAHVRINPCYLICVMHLVRSRATSFMRAQHVLSYHLIQVP